MAMREVVVAIYESRSAARAAIEDLQVARVPSAVVHPNVKWESVGPDQRSITVSVDGRHASAVTAILELQVPLSLESATAQ
jgi:hypothetical protein